MGYKVSTFSDPHLAIEEFRREPGAFALLITDMNMPSLSGIQVAKALIERRPELPVMLLSGNVSDEVRAEAVANGVRLVLQKPWTVEELAEAVHRLLT